MFNEGKSKGPGSIIFRCSASPLFFPYLPGEPRQCLFYRGAALRANKDATLQPPLRRLLFHALLQSFHFYAWPRSARSRSRATSQLSPGR